MIARTIAAFLASAMFLNIANAANASTNANVTRMPAFAVYNAENMISIEPAAYTTPLAGCCLQWTTNGTSFQRFSSYATVPVANNIHCSNETETYTVPITASRFRADVYAFHFDCWDFNSSMTSAGDQLNVRITLGQQQNNTAVNATSSTGSAGVNATSSTGSAGVNATSSTGISGNSTQPSMNATSSTGSAGVNATSSTGSAGVNATSSTGISGNSTQPSMNATSSTGSAGVNTTSSTGVSGNSTASTAGPSGNETLAVSSSAPAGLSSSSGAGNWMSSSSGSNVILSSSASVIVSSSSGVKVNGTSSTGTNANATSSTGTSGSRSSSTGAAGNATSSTGNPAVSSSSIPAPVGNPPNTMAARFEIEITGTTVPENLKTLIRVDLCTVVAQQFNTTFQIVDPFCLVEVGSPVAAARRLLAARVPITFTLLGNITSVVDTTPGGGAPVSSPVAAINFIKQAIQTGTPILTTTASNLGIVVPVQTVVVEDVSDPVESSTGVEGPAPEDSSSSGLAGGAIAGIVIGVIVGVALLSIVGYAAFTGKMCFKGSASVGVAHATTTPVHVKATKDAEVV